MNPGKLSKSKTMKCDIVCIGGGGCGLAAAVTAAERGAKVILVEKQALGGNTAMAQCLFGADSDVQNSMRIIAPQDELYKAAMQYSHWKTNPRIVRMLVNKSGDTIRWLEEKGIGFDRVISWCNQYPPVLHAAGFKGTGFEIIKALHKDCDDLGVQILLHCRAKGILTDPEGKISGILAEKDGKEFKILAKSIIVATGGYGGNKEFLNKYCQPYGENIRRVGLPLMGDGITMATGIGAATEGLGTLLLHPPEFPHYIYFNTFASHGSIIWLNKKGERFIDESIFYRLPEVANAVDRQVHDKPDKSIYILFDEKIKQDIRDKVIHTKLSLQIAPIAELNWDNMEKELKVQADKGNIKISKSMDKIAAWMGAIPEVLRSTIEEYNACCNQGYDEAFLKDRKYLKPICNPPYYVVKYTHVFLTTLGGIKINHNMEVLNKQDIPIKGLYAGGDTAGGWITDSYSVILGGGACSFALSSGRIAGENAARFVNHIG